MTSALTTSTEATMTLDGAKLAKGKTRIEIFTDGATDGSNPGPAGWGFVALLLDEAGDLIDKVERKGASRIVSTNNRAEMAGALNALTFAAEQQASGAWPVCPITIISDSQILVHGMTAWMPGWLAKGWRKNNKNEVANRDLWERLHAGTADNCRPMRSAATVNLTYHGQVMTPASVRRRVEIRQADVG